MISQRRGNSREFDETATRSSPKGFSGMLPSTETTLDKEGDYVEVD